MRLLFVGDLVGDAAVDYVTTLLPELRGRYQLDAVVVNGENMAVTGRRPHGGFGMLTGQVARLFDAGVDVITSGNHAWDGPEAAKVLAHQRVLRPQNVPEDLAGTGITTVDVGGERLTVINLASTTAIAGAGQPYRAFAGLKFPEGACLVDFHGESVMEKYSFAYAVDGSVSAVFGTHTHEPTTQTHILPGGTAFVAEIGMTGPLGGIQGIAPDYFVRWMTGADDSDLPRFALAPGPMSIGAVVCDIEGGLTRAIERVESR